MNNIKNMWSQSLAQLSRFGVSQGPMQLSVGLLTLVLQISATSLSTNRSMAVVRLSNVFTHVNTAFFPVRLNRQKTQQYHVIHNTQRQTQYLRIALHKNHKFITLKCVRKKTTISQASFKSQDIKNQEITSIGLQYRLSCFLILSCNFQPSILTTLKMIIIKQTLIKRTKSITWIKIRARMTQRNAQIETGNYFVNLNFAFDLYSKLPTSATITID
eukprot:TRINITY_DN2073_c0_g1_i1.p2 TRINITY_DN2073_c0_g1~~TRINITY_DN2073_c0_g1_i1.p2  ORF type:complete len:216 (-),score=-18.25 TRINITY_DN2073_c0_g1_i1:449-1096(-)